MSKVYFHVDLNAFFANAEVLKDPSLKDKPIAVAGQTRRSVISTASYAARKYGVTSAMPVVIALKLCPTLEIIEGHYQYYQQLSNEFINIIKSFSPLIEKASIDECYVDVSEIIKRYKYPLDLAILMQKKVYQKIGLTCSIGIAPNLFLAKMASNMKKPNGITILRIRDIADKLWPLDISEMQGIGKQTLIRVKELGIQTIGDLAKFKNIHKLNTIFKKRTDDIIAKANGIDHTELIIDMPRKSISVSETLLEDVNDYDELKGIFRILAKKVAHNLQKEEKIGQTIAIRITYHNFRNISHSIQVKEGILYSEDIFYLAMQLFDQYWQNDEPIRLLGITIAKLVDKTQNSQQLSLFHNHKKDKSQEVIDEINNLLISSPLLFKASEIKKYKKKGR